MGGMSRTSAGPSRRSPLVVTAAVIEDRGKVLVAKRKRGDRFEGLWEFPGGKVEPGESPEDSLKRELLEELGVEVEVGERLCGHPFLSGEVPMELLVFRTRIVDGDVVCRDHAELRWVEPGDLENYPLTEPDRCALADLFPAKGDPAR
jgi:8-oxo-dGTP diphosphatase